jgi:peptidoglycan L-alanyl-D-glutamate endopeptidase CwlK
MKLSDRSLKNMEGLHPDLQIVIHRAAEITDLDFVVTEGLRTIERQKLMVSKGASKTMNSRHLTGHAFDFAAILDGKIDWSWPLYHTLAETFKEAAHIEGIPITWGGDWKMKDGPHIELSWKVYP